HSSTPLHYFHSFPTRRSSDLSVLASRKVKNIIANPQVSLIVDVRKSVSEKWVCASGTAEIIKGEESRKINTEVFKRYVTPAGLEDRKSTRLNSSHVSISYAVF